MLSPDHIRLLAIVELARREMEGAKAHAEYQNDPIGFAVDHLGIREETLRWSLNPGYKNHVWDGTPEPIVAIAEALVEWQDIGVESATGTGKSHTLGWATLWFDAVWQGARVYSFAAKEEQLDFYAWTEIKKLWPAFKRLYPTAELTRLRIRMDGARDEGEGAGWGAVGRSIGVGAHEQVSTKAAGMHAPHMLILVEEAPGVPLPVSAAIEHTCTDPHNLRVYVGNPDNQHDTLHEFCTSPGVRHIRISALDHPNIVVNNLRDPEWEDLNNDVAVVPGAVSRKSIVRRREKYGEDSSIYRSRIRGISPPEAQDSLIKWAWCEEAVAHYSDPAFRVGAVALGVDCANSESGDKAAIATGKGACLMGVRSFACPDSSQLGIDVGALIQADDIDPRQVGVDSVGIGAGTIGSLKQMGYPVRGLNAGSRAVGSLDSEARARTGRSVYSDEQFANLRSQMWWKLRTDLQRGHIALPDDHELFEDLTIPTYFTRNGKIFIEPKEEIRKRLGRSPDKGDAVVMWNFVRSRPVFKKPAEEPKKDRNTDYGLEKRLERIAKQQRLEKRIFARHARQQRLEKRYPF